MAFCFFDATQAPLSPQAIAQQRDVARALVMNGGMPQNFGQGLSALGDGIAANVLEGRADAAGMGIPEFPSAPQTFGNLFGLGALLGGNEGGGLF